MREFFGEKGGRKQIKAAVIEEQMENNNTEGEIKALSQIQEFFNSSSYEYDTDYDDYYFNMRDVMKGLIESHKIDQTIFRRPEAQELVDNYCLSRLQYPESFPFHDLAGLFEVIGYKPDFKLSKFKPFIERMYKDNLSKNFLSGATQAIAFFDVLPKLPPKYMEGLIKKVLNPYSEYQVHCRDSREDDGFFEYPNKLSSTLDILENFVYSVCIEKVDFTKYKIELKNRYIAEIKNYNGNDEISFITEHTGVNIDWKDPDFVAAVQQSYFILMREDRAEWIIDLFELSGINPVLPNVEDEIFVRAVARMSEDKQKKLLDIVLPENNKRSEYLAQRVKKQNIINTVLSCSNPEWLSRFLEKLIDSGEMPLEKLNFLRKNKEAKRHIQSIYVNIIFISFQYNSSATTRENLLRFKKLTGISWEDADFFDVSESEVKEIFSGISRIGQSDYHAEMAQKALNRMEELLSGFDYKRVSNEIQQAYASLLFVYNKYNREEIGGKEIAEKIQKITGIKPDLRQKAFKTKFLEESVKTIERLNLQSTEEGIKRLVAIAKNVGVDLPWRGELSKPLAILYERCIFQIEHSDYNDNVIKVLSFLISTTGVDFPKTPAMEQNLKDVYKKYYKKGLITNIKELIKITNIQPVFTASESEDIYLFWIQKDSLEKFDEFKFAGLLSRHPDFQGPLKKKIIDKVFKTVGMHNAKQKIAELSKTTGIDFDFQKELRPLVLDEFFRYMADHRDIQYLVEVFGFKPDFKAECYQRTQELFASIGFRKIGEISHVVGVTGIEPDFSLPILLNKLKEQYGVIIENGEFHNLRKLVLLSKIEPDIVREFRPFLIRRLLTYFSSLIVSYSDPVKGLSKELEAYPAVKINFITELPEAVGGVYKKCLRGARLDYVDGLEAFTHVIPDYNACREDVLAGYDNCLKNFYNSEEWRERFSELQKRTNIEPSFTEIGKVFIPFIRDCKNNNFTQAESVVRLIRQSNNFVNKENFWSKYFDQNWDGQVPKEFVKWYESTFPEKASSLSSAIKNSAEKRCFEFIAEENYDYAQKIIQANKLVLDKDKLLESAMNCFSKGLLPDGLLQICLQQRVPLEVSLKNVQNTNFNFRTSAMIINSFLPKNKEERNEIKENLMNKSALYRAIPRLLDLQGISARMDFCPWQQNLMPLIKTLEKGGALSDRQVDGLVEYVRRFGMTNFPLLAKINVELAALRCSLKNREAHPYSFTTAVQNTLENFWKAHGLAHSVEEIKEPQAIDKILDEIQTKIEELKGAILNDTIPPTLETSELDMELFNAVVAKTGSYGNLNDRGSLILKWRNLCKVDSDTRAPSYFPTGDRAPTYQLQCKNRELSFEDILAQAEEASDDPIQLEKRRLLLLELRKQKEKLLANQPFQKFLLQMMNAENVVSAMEKEPCANELFLELSVTSLRQKRAEMLIKLDKIRNTTNLNPKALEGMEKRISDTEKFIKTLDKLGTKEGLYQIIDEEVSRLSKADGVPEKEADRKILQQYLAAFDELSPAENFAMLLEAMRIQIGKEGMLGECENSASAIMMALHKILAPGHFNAIRQASVASQGEITEDLMNAWNSLFEDEVLQHFVNPDEKRFTASTLSYIESAWRLIGKRKALADKNLSVDIRHEFYDIVKAVKNINANIDKIENPQKASLKENISTVPVKFYAVHGLGRIFAGDISNACYDKQRNLLAENKFQKINAVLMAQESNKTLRLLGAFLTIEADTEGGKKVLIIRALNPTDAVIKREIRAEEFVRSAVEYVTEIARNNNFDEARICVSNRGVHSTNIQEVAEEIYVQVKKQKLIPGSRLADTPETNFNGYNIAREGETYVVWSRNKN